ncbi:hypothetical protein E3N88_06522 [Mikania micrantha]|uniref:Uncharacterized protein n=1 Tax=Mikania micrantha TaxID=192012 RepID=A0A5N6PQ83_9ASTR|nr:hypothetical protein E3N88_06522 [Mikania micrantha]
MPRRFVSPFDARAISFCTLRLLSPSIRVSKLQKEMDDEEDERFEEEEFEDKEYTYEDDEHEMDFSDHSSHEDEFDS